MENVKEVLENLSKEIYQLVKEKLTLTEHAVELAHVKFSVQKKHPTQATEQLQNKEEGVLNAYTCTYNDQGQPTCTP